LYNNWEHLKSTKKFFSLNYPLIQIYIVFIMRIRANSAGT
jgi:hypothetical protein